MLTAEGDSDDTYECLVLCLVLYIRLYYIIILFVCFCIIELLMS